MTWLYAVNAFLLQWFFVRLGRVRDVRSGRTVGWRLMRWIVPTTGWSRPYRYIGRPRG